jgi:hypothetical protein
MQSYWPLAWVMSVGGCFRYLEEAKAREPIHGEGNILANLTFVLDSLVSLELSHSSNSPYAPLLRSLLQELNQAKQSASLGAANAQRLSDLARRLWLTVSAEAQARLMCMATNTRFKTEFLLNVAALLEAGNFASLPDICQSDLSEAGACLAFGRPTAAAFHALRAAEAVIRLIYSKRIENAPDHIVWKLALDRLAGSDVPSSVLANFDNLRRNYRNPTDHPDTVFNLEQAQAVFGLCLTAIDQAHSYCV